MKLNAIGSNQTEVTIGNKRVLFSYSTPVAYYENGMYFKTSKKWSKTTSKHINQWIGGSPVNEIAQDLMDRVAQ